MENKRQSVMINVFGEDYAIRSDSDQEYTKKVAKYLNRKMKEVADSLSTRTYSKVAVLAAMNITDKLFKEKIDKENTLSQVEEKAQTLLKWLDDKLGQEA